MPALPRLERPLADGEVALRAWRSADAAPMAALLNDPEIARWTRVPSPYTDHHAEEFLRLMEVARRAGEELALAVTDPESDELLGSMSLRITSWDDLRGEIGYLVFAAARGRGVAPRAVRLLTRLAFDEIGLCRVGILTAVENVASQRVAEKAGFQREGVLRSYGAVKEGRHDMISWSLLPDEL